MTDHDPAAARAAFVEELGDLFAQMGSPRIAGRVLAWLLVCDPPYQSAQQIGEAVQASKASVSTVVRQLLAGGMLERQGLPGDRRTYYRVGPSAWGQVFNAKMRFTVALEQIAERNLERLEPAPDDNRLRGMARFYAFLTREMDQILERWEASEGGTL